MAYNDRGSAHAAKGRYDRAIADFDQAIKLNPDNGSRLLQPRPRATTAGAISIAPSPTSTRRSSSIRTTRRPTTTAAWRTTTSGDFDRAIADFEPGHQARCRATPWPTTTAASRITARRDFDRAIADFDQAIKLDGKMALAFHNRGIAYRDKGDYDRAIADLDQAIKLNGSSAPALQRSRRWPTAPRASSTAPSGTSTRRSSSIRTTRRRCTTAASPTTSRATTTARIADFDQAIKLNPSYVVRVLQPRQCALRQGRARPGAGELQPGDQAQPERSGGVPQSRQCLCRQARHRPRHRRLRARRSSSTRTTRSPTTIAAWPMARAATCSARWRTSTSRSSSTRTARWRTTTAA